MPSEISERNRFVLKNVARGVLGLIIIVIAYMVFKKYLQHYQEWLTPISSRPLLVYTIFFISEAIIGIIPPEFFVVWSLDESPVVFCLKVAVLAAISYLGGLLAFWYGQKFRDTQLLASVRKINFFKTYELKYRQYGSILIVLSAMTPLPFALIAMVSGYMHFSFPGYSKLALFRFLRFAIYSWAIWQANLV